MAIYETNAAAQQALAQKLQDIGKELRRLSSSTNPADKARYDELSRESGRIQNQMMMAGSGVTGLFGAVGGGLAKGVSSVVTGLPDLAVMGYNALTDSKTKTLGEWMTPGLESVSQENAGVYGAARGVGSSVGLGKTLAALNVGANWFDEYMAGGSPMAQTVLAAGSLLELGRRGAYKFLQSRDAKKLMSSLPPEDVNALETLMVKGQSGLDPVMAGRISKLRNNPKFAEFFDVLEKKASTEILKGARQEANAAYPTDKVGVDVFKSIDNRLQELRLAKDELPRAKYEAAARMGGNNDIIMTDTTVKNLDNLIGEFSKKLSTKTGKEVGTTDAQSAVNFMTALRDDLAAGRISVERMQALLSEFGSQAKTGESLIANVTPASQNRIASAIFGGLADDLKLTAQTSTVPRIREIANLLEGARKQTKLGYDEINKFVAQGLPAKYRNVNINQIDTVEMLDDISKLSNTQRNVVAALLKDTYPDAWKRIQQSAFDDFTRTTKTADGSGIDLQKFVTKWNGLEADDKAKLATTMGTTLNDLESRMKDANGFFRFDKIAKGVEDPALLNKTVAGQAGYVIGGYPGSKLAEATVGVWNRIKGGLSEEQTLNLLLAPETKGVLREAALSPNAAKTLERVTQSLDSSFAPVINFGVRQSVSAAQKANEPAEEVTPQEPTGGAPIEKLNLEGVDPALLEEIKKETPKLNLEGVDLNLLSKQWSIEDKIRAEADKQGLSQYADLFVAQARRESGFNPTIVSNKGAQGVFQLMPATAKELGVADVFNEDQNITGGIKYMGQLLNKYKDPKTALAAYNWGMGNVSTQGLENMPRETQEYLKDILG